MNKERIECGGYAGIWGMSLALEPFFKSPCSRRGDFEKNLPIGGKTSGFTTATTAKGMKALSDKALACGGYPPQRLQPSTAPPQK
jgi:hypothetical protein